jgi:hypothetical protein
VQPQRSSSVGSGASTEPGRFMTGFLYDSLVDWLTREC